MTNEALGSSEEIRKPPPRRRDDAKAAEIARLKVEMERRVREARDEHLLRAAAGAAAAIWLMSRSY